jgi:hypothetical protein
MTESPALDELQRKCLAYVAEHYGIDEDLSEATWSAACEQVVMVPQGSVVDRERAAERCHKAFGELLLLASSLERDVARGEAMPGDVFDRRRWAAELLGKFNERLEDRSAKPTPDWMTRAMVSAVGTWLINVRGGLRDATSAFHENSDPG